MEKLKLLAYNLLRRSERYFKTDMVYLAQGGFWLGFGQVLSAVIAFGSSLFFANLISKDLYGNYKFIIATTSVLGAFSLSGMSSVVTQGVAQGFEGILKNAVKTTLKWSVIIVGVAISISAYYFLNGNNVLGLVMLVAGVSLPINQAFSLYGNYLVGKKDFRRNTLYAIGSQLLNTIVVILSALITKSVLVMMFSYFILNTITTLWAYRHVVRQFYVNEDHDRSLIPYGKHLSVMGLLGTIANQFDKLLIFHYLGSVQLAVYAFAQAMPDQFKGALKSLFGLVLPRYAALSQLEIRNSIKRKIVLLTSITIVLVSIYIIAAPFIFKVLFPKYFESVFYSQIYILGLITIPGISLFATYFQLKKATRKMYELNLIGNISTLVVTLCLIYKYGLMGAVVANGISWFIILTVHWYYFLKDRPDIDQVKII